jgi:hypothetical protein
VEWTSTNKLASATTSSRRGWIPPAAATLAALGVCLAVFEFTVDDAWITARYAHHLATGAGYVFNRGGPVTDGVTPLGHAHLLAPFGAAGALEAARAAKWLGLLAHLVSVAVIGRLVTRLGESAWRFAPLAVWAMSPQPSAWAVSGMETPLVAACVAFGLERKLSGSRLAPWLLGMAAAWRPELSPLVIVLAMPRPETASPAARIELDVVGWFARLCVAMLPLAIVTSLRLWFFGAAAPLAVLAKRPDPSRGLAYVGASLLLVGACQLASPSLLRTGPRLARWAAIAFAAHSVSIVLAGGDWMALSRLFVPALPVLVYAAASVARRGGTVAPALRAAGAATGALFAWSAVGWDLGRVGRDRADLLRELGPALAEARTVAAVDVGWVGVAAPLAEVVDLAGVTDPTVARLPGPHTGKKIPDGFLEQRGVDTLVLNLSGDESITEPWVYSRFTHGVERYLALEPGLADRFVVVARRRDRPPYVVLKRNP